MIKVIIQNDCIKVEGHAMFDEYGKDIVCASASTIVITTVNAILSIDQKAIEVVKKDGFISIKIIKHTSYVNALINNMINLLKELENKYKKNIKVKEVH